MGESEPVAADALLTARAAADYLGISRSTLTRWRLARKIGAIRMPSGQHRYAASELTAIRTGTTPHDVSQRVPRQAVRADA